MEKKVWYGGNAFRHAWKGGLALLAGASLLACGADDNPAGVTRVHIPSSIAASATGCGTVVVDGANVQTYNLSATWQATGTWRAMFVDVGTGKTLATTDIDASQTKVSIERDPDTGAITKQCLFKKGDVAYAILFPAGDQPVASDADLTATITVGQ